MTNEEEMIMEYHIKKWEEEQRAKRLGMMGKITWSAPFGSRFVVIEEKEVE